MFHTPTLASKAVTDVNRKRKTYAPGTAMLLILLLGFFVRVEDFQHWKQRYERCFFGDQPLLSALDGYYYLRLARDLTEGTYERTDPIKYAPAPRARPDPPPLLSVLAAGIHSITPWSLDWIAFFLPAFLGVLLALPLYGLGRQFAGPVCGLVAALLGVLAPYTVYRSGMGWFDTDCMNVTWSLTAAYCFLRFGDEKDWPRYLYLAAGITTSALFAWWWDKAAEEALLLALLPLPICVIFFYRPSKRRDWLCLAVLALGVAAMLGWQHSHIIDRVRSVAASASARLRTLSEPSLGAFPAQIISTSEQTRPTFEYLANATTNSAPSLVLGACGFLWLLLKRTKHILVTAPTFAVGIMSLVFAERFIIFLSPALALGHGYIVSRIWESRKYWARFLLGRPALAYCTPALGTICLVLTTGIAALPFGALMTSITSYPKTDASTISGIVAVGEHTASNAVIWAWWDSGNALNYWARRKTIGNGQDHGGAFSVYNALPLAASDERLAANFIQFYARRGKWGVNKVIAACGGDQKSGIGTLKKLLAVGPEAAAQMIKEPQMASFRGRKSVQSWISFLFPQDTPPVYLFLDNSYIGTAYWWHWFGTWDPKKQTGIHPHYDPFYNVEFKDGVITGDQGLRINTRSGLCESDYGWRHLDHIMIRTTHHRMDRDYDNGDGYRFEMDAPHRFGMATDSDIAESVFNRLFVRSDTSMQHFTLVLQNAPYYQLWEVGGDR